MMNIKSALCNEKITTPLNVGVARHSILGATVYRANLRNQINKVKYNQDSYGMDGNNMKGSCFSFDFFTRKIGKRLRDTSFVCLDRRVLTSQKYMTSYPLRACDLML